MTFPNYFQAYVTILKWCLMTNVTRKLSIKSRSNNVLRGAVPTTSSDLNIEILYDEFSEAVDKSNLRKSYLEIPNEAMKNRNAILLLFEFFNLCFISGLNPSDWNVSDIMHGTPSKTDASQ